MRTLGDAPDLMSFFLQRRARALRSGVCSCRRRPSPPQALAALEAVAELLRRPGRRRRSQPPKPPSAGLAEELGLKAGQLFMPIRVAVTGRTESPGLFETLRVIGNDRVRARIETAIEKLGSTVR